MPMRYIIYIRYKTSGTCAQAHTRMTEKEVEEVDDEGMEDPGRGEGGGGRRMRGRRRRRRRRRRRGGGEGKGEGKGEGGGEGGGGE